MFLPQGTTLKRRLKRAKRVETKRVRKFQLAWIEFYWVCYDLKTKKMSCFTCWKFPELADKSRSMHIEYGGEVEGFRRETLTAHSEKWSPCCLPYETAGALNVFIGYLAFHSTETWLKENEKNFKARISAAECLG